jgi:hypothetical protein
MRGLDPRIIHLRKILAKKMDCRVKPGDDGCEGCVPRTQRSAELFA